MKAKAGEMATDMAPVGPVMITIALPLRVGSAALVAVTVTGFDEGTTAGARKSMAPEPGPVGATHGTVKCWQIWPRIVFPLTTPFTDQVTAVFEVLATAGVSVTRWLIATEVADGATVTLTLLTIVTAAEAIAFPATAWTGTGLLVGKDVGAVYCAALAPVPTIVPTVALPPGIPFTSQVIAVVAVGQNVAAKFCVKPSATFAAPGDMEFVPEHTIVALALAVFVVSAMLVAVTVTVGRVWASLQAPCITLPLTRSR
jgi:hypothetical protein